uniref:HAT C-terminal dimerisation domain-containing protein n=1 Tax=Sinocyclocheilus rhinocerous TaxID=307959 RepID=A0A673H030_9TELE
MQGGQQRGQRRKAEKHHRQKGHQPQVRKETGVCIKRTSISKEFIQYGFTCVIVNEIQHPQCVVCTEVLALESLKPVKMLQHLKTKHPSLAVKPVDFFRQKEQELQGRKKVLTKQTTIPTKAQQASYEVAYLIARAKKPHMIGGTLIKPAISRARHGDKLARELESVPLSNGTVARRISDMAQDIKCQLVDRVKKGKYALQLDEFTDVSNSSQLLVLVRYSFDGKFYEDILFCTPLEGTCTGEDIFTKLDNKLKEDGLSWSKCIGVCTDGAGAMLGEKKGLKARHVHAISDCLPLCNELGSEHDCLLFHTDVRWLSQGNVLSRLFELQDEVHLFLMEHGFQLADHLTDPDWLTRLAYNVISKVYHYPPSKTAPEQYGWIRSPFTVTRVNHLTSDLEDTVVELSSDLVFNSKRLADFWISDEREYPQQSKATMDVLMPFCTIYLCEKTFSALTYIKNKYRSRLDVEDDLRVAVSKIKPRMDLLCSKKHPSH